MNNAKEYQKQWRIKNAELIKFHREINKDKIKAYREINRDRIKKQRREYRRKNKKQCTERTRLWRKNNLEKFKRYSELYSKRTRLARMNRRLQKKFGITIENYNVLLESQNQRCAICRRHKDEFKRALHVDHTHSNNQIRGLLCVNCNQMLGHSMEKEENLRRGIEYLQKFSEKILLPPFEKSTVDKLSGCAILTP